MPTMVKIAPYQGARSAKSAISARIAQIAREYLVETGEAHETALIERTIDRLVYEYSIKHHNEWMLATAYNDADRFAKIARGIAWDCSIICGLRDRIEPVVHFNPPIADRGVERAVPTFMGLSCERCDEAFKMRDEVVEVIENRTKARLLVHADSCFLKSDQIAHNVMKH